MNRPYPLRSGDPVDADKLTRARSFASGASYALSVAIAQDGRSDAERDFNLDEASAALDEAQRLLAEARMPEPPRVRPVGMPPLVEVLFDIATPMNTEAA
jgi:hypothetical protein